jgi:hypothetical protein
VEKEVALLKNEGKVFTEKKYLLIIENVEQNEKRTKVYSSFPDGREKFKNPILG